MSSRNFAQWVEPVALQLERSRTDIEELVKALPEGSWQNPSAYPGWSYKDHLSHLPHAHRGVHGVLQAIIDGRTPDFSRFMRIDEINEENRREHQATSIDDLLAAFVDESAKTEDLLSSLNDEHAEGKFGPMTISQALEGFAMHDISHGAEIRKALQA